MNTDTITPPVPDTNLFLPPAPVPGGGIPNVSAASLKIDKADLKLFVTALFCRADPQSYISLRAFDQHDRGKSPIFCVGVQHSEGMDAIAEKAVNGAMLAAEATPAGVFAPPVCTFKTAFPATMANIADGVAISVDIDGGDIRAARAKLEDILGPATIVMESGSDSIDLATGEVQRKLHLHWRLTVPTRTPEEHQILRRARYAAAKIAGGDTTAAPPSHPLRWPGSWNIKNPDRPTIAKIIGGEPWSEVDLIESLVKLEARAEQLDNIDRAMADMQAQFDATAAAGEQLQPKARKAAQSGLPQAPIGRIISALAAIPNPEPKDGKSTWDFWNKMGMTIYAASGGSLEGLAAWITWSSKSSQHSDKACAERWENYERSPPTELIPTAEFSDSWGIPRRGEL